MIPFTPPFIAVALVSAAALAYEILLMRLFSIIQWHHFAYMIISVAMLGYGAAGTFVSLAQRALRAHFLPVFVASAAAFGVTSVACFFLAQAIAFNPLEILWDPQQPLRLLAIYTLLLVPFFCAATCTCLTLTEFGTESHRIYAYDIAGAALGCLGIVAILFALTPPTALLAIGAIGFVAAAAAAMRSAVRMQALWLAPFCIALVACLALPDEWRRLEPSDYKELSQALRIAGNRIVAERTSPLGLISVVESTQVPFRYAPGQSLNATAEPPPQLAVFTDGDGMSAIARYEGRLGSLAYLDDLTSALPYHLLSQPRVLVLGAGTGADILQAMYHGAASTDAVELNAQTIDLVEKQFAAFSGKPFSAPNVRVHIAEARRFVTTSEATYDVIQVALVDAFGASAAGLHALSESYLYTVDGLRDYIHRLAPGGMLAITRWVTLPPRDTLKLFATAITALERDGVPQPAQQLALIRGWRTATLLVRNGAFTATEIDALKAFCRARSFDVEYYPGINPQEANRYNVIDQSWFHDGAVALLGPARNVFLDQYKYDVSPATDDRPYFFHFFKWRTVPELLALKERGGLPLLEWGYPVLVATLAQAVVLGAALVVAPLFIVRRAAPKDVEKGSPLRAGAYFLALGCGFMFVEIAFIQKFILFLGHPLYAVAVVLFSFLVFAALGSRYSARVALIPATIGVAGYVPPMPCMIGVAGPVVGIAVLALAYVVILPGLFRNLIAAPDVFRVFIAMLLIAPLAFAMGMPFPRGLRWLAAQAPSLIPWAWAANACASVMAAILATLLAVHLGFDAVIVLAVLFYVAAAACTGRRSAARPSL